MAIKNAHNDIVELLLANPNVRNILGETPLYNACRNGHLALVTTFLDSGADPNIANTLGGTPLMVAIENGHSDIFELLLKANVDLNVSKHKWRNSYLSRLSTWSS